MFIRWEQMEERRGGDIAKGTVDERKKLALQCMTLSPLHFLNGRSKMAFTLVNSVLLCSLKQDVV